MIFYQELKDYIADNNSISDQILDKIINLLIKCKKPAEVWTKIYYQL